jgi:hypothetical protein
MFMEYFMLSGVCSSLLPLRFHIEGHVPCVSRPFWYHDPTANGYSFVPRHPADWVVFILGACE